MDELFATVFQIQRFVVAALVLVGVAALAIAGLVFLLSNRLRRREFALTVSLHAGRAAARLWTTDLSQAYVRINAGYRT